MKTQQEIRAEFDRLLEEDRLEEAEVLIEQIIPVSWEEFRRRPDEAPLDDEPVTPEQRRRLDEVHEAAARHRAFIIAEEFRQKLALPLEEADRDALNRAAVLLGVSLDVSGD